jgi:ClpP class serine protease
MGSWLDILNDIQQRGSQFDIVRRELLNKFSEITGRNTIAYYSGWCQKPNVDPSLISINDDDMNGFMNSVKGLKDRNQGVNLVIHTPGGNIASTEKIVHYLNKKFNNKIYTYVPQIAYSCGTLLALASKKIIWAIIRILVLSIHILII